MGLLALLVVSFAVWLIWSGRLARMTGVDGVMLGVAVLGAIIAARGKPLMGGSALAGAALYAAYRHKRMHSRPVRPEPQEVVEARELLGLAPECNEDDIREAHRRIIARVHPDVGGTAALAEKANSARNLLLRYHLETKRSQNGTSS